MYDVQELITCCQQGHVGKVTVHEGLSRPATEWQEHRRQTWHTGRGFENIFFVFSQQISFYVRVTSSTVAGGTSVSISTTRRAHPATQTSLAAHGRNARHTGSGVAE